MNQNTENGYTLKRDNTNRLHYHIHTEPKKILVFVKFFGYLLKNMEEVALLTED